LNPLLKHWQQPTFSKQGEQQMEKQFKPMKPPTGVLNLDDVKYPIYGSIKYDGFRVAIKGGKTVLNSLRELDNLHARALLTSIPELEDTDGELVMLPLNDNKCFNRCQSAFRAAKGEPDFCFVVFDRINALTFEERWVNYTKPAYPAWVMVDVPVLLENREELDIFIDEVLADGHEGVCLRRPDSLYKFGRGGFKTQELLRVKPMETAEGVVVGFECEYENTNEATVNALGRSKRSSAKDGLVPKDTCGKLICDTERWGKVSISGFSDAMADEIWQNKDKFMGELATFNFQEIGSIDQPRLAKFKGFRARADMGAN
jgi:DNA ligase-1